jgi:hypothetical protein
MKTGIELAKLQIEKNGYCCFEVQGPKGQTIATQLEQVKTSDAICELEQIAESLPPGRYTLILSKAVNKAEGRVLRGARGTGAVEIPLNILHNAGHIDVNSHNATAHTLANREYRELLNEIKDLEKKLLLLEIENQRLKAENDSGGINGVFNNPNVQNLIAVIAQSYMAKNGTPTQ